MKKWVLMALLAVFFLAIFMRLVPLTQYEVWGSDTGEYYRITSQLTSDGFVSQDYDGWGFGYPYFPGMYSISGSVNLLMGMDNLMALIIVIPVIASLSVLVVFFIAKLLFGKDEASLVASAMVAVALPHVFPTSHAVPGSIGDVLFLFSLLLLLLSIKNKIFFPLLILSAMALTITHHLSSYFLFIAVLGGLFVVEMLRNEDKKDLKLCWIFLFSFLTLIILYWTLAAPSFSERVVSMAFEIPPWILLSFGYVALFLAYILIKIRRRFSWDYQVKLPKVKTRLVWYFVQLFVLFVTILIMAFVKIPGTNMELDPIIVLIFSPLIVLLAFLSVGTGYLRLYDHGMMVYGWILALILSLLIGIATSNHVLLSYRHPQYLMMPLALAIGLGLAMIFTIFFKEKTLSKKAIYIGIVVGLLLLTSLSAYPPKGAIGGFQEGTSAEDMQAVFWAKESLDTGSTVVSDHRMSSMLFGFAGLNATWDSARKTLHSSSYEECRDEIEEVDTPSGDKPIDYVLLDDDIKEGAALLQWENAEPMSSEAKEKFEKWPFVKLYEANGVEVYGLAR